MNGFFGAPLRGHFIRSAEGAANLTREENERVNKLIDEANELYEKAYAKFREACRITGGPYQI